MTSTWSTVGAVGLRTHRPGGAVLLAGSAVALTAVGTLLTASVLGRSPDLLWASVGLAVAAVAALAVRRWVRRGAPVAAPGMVSAIAVSALLLRWVPVLQDRGASGTLSVAGTEFRVGEFTRPVVVVCLALLLAASRAPGRRWVRRRVLGLAVAAVSSLAVVGDLGPALVIAVACWVLWVRGTSSRGALLMPVGIVVGGLVLGDAVLPDRVLGRFADTWWGGARPSGQTEVARSLLGDSALVGRGWDSVPGGGALAAAATDYVLASCILALGIGVTGVLVTGWFAGLGAVGDRLARREDVPALVGAGLVVLLVTQSALATLGPLGLVPLTGLPFPLLSVTGSSVLPAAAVVGALIGLGTRALDVARTTPAASGRWFGTGLRALAALCVVGVVVGWVLAVGTRGAQVPAVALASPRGALVTADGHVVAPASATAVDRRWPDGDLYLALGWTAPGAVYGIERSAGPSLTCGATAGLLADLTGALLAAPCRPATVVSTMRHEVMTAAAAAVGSAPATVVVADARTGGVLADVTGGVHRLTDEDGGGVAAGGVDGVQGAPSRMDTSAPGSVFKLVTAAAALEAGVEPAGVGAVYRVPGGGTVRNEWGGPCPRGTVTAMLAYSCNTVAAQLAVDVGAADLDRVAREQFGFGSAVVAGLSVDPATTGLTEGSTADDVARCGFGQGSVRTGALAMTQAVVQLLTDGRPTPLTYVAGVVGDDGELRPAPTPTTGPSVGVPSDVADAVLTGMRAAVDDGTARALGRLDDRDLAAKTGSAEVVREGVPMTDSWISVVVDERWVITVLVRGSISDADPASRSAALALVPAVLDGLAALA